MKMLRRGWYSLVVGLCLWAAAPALAQNHIDDFENMKVEFLELRLADAKTYRVLKSSLKVINSPSRCGAHLNKAKQTRRALLALNKQYQGNANQEYLTKHGNIKTKNTAALTDYKHCFYQQAQSFETLSSRHYVLHKRQMANLKPKFKDVSDLNVYIKDLEDAIERRKKFAGSIASVFQRVEIRRGGRGAWVNAGKNTKLFLSDELRTGPKGRVRIVFADYYTQGNAGPSVVNVGSNSHIRLEKFVVSFTDPKEFNLVIDLVWGSVRAFTKNWGLHSSFRVRTGTSLCGIRGTEVAVTYNPQTKVAKYHLAHGDAYAQVNGRQTTLTPLTSVTVQNNRLSPPVSFASGEWDGIVSKTGAGYAESLDTARADKTLLSYRGGSKASVQSDHKVFDTVRKSITSGYPMIIVEGMLKGMEDNRIDIVLNSHTGVLKQELIKIKKQIKAKNMGLKDITYAGGYLVRGKVQCGICGYEGVGADSKHICRVSAKLLFSNQSPKFALYTVNRAVEKDENGMNTTRISRVKLISASEATIFKQKAHNCR